MNNYLRGCVLMFIILLIQNSCFCQDILYKKDSTQINVKILNFNGNTITYKLTGDESGRMFYLSKTALDSLKYEKGKIYRFTNPAIPVAAYRKVIGRNYLGVELINTFCGLVNIEYERLSGNGNAGFVAGILVNASGNDIRFWESESYIFEYSNFRPYYFFIRTGVNYYPFNLSLEKSSMARFSTGLNLLAGTVKKIDYSYYTDTSYPINPAFNVIITWSARERFYLGDAFQVSAGMEVSLIPFLRFFNPQLSMSISF